MNSKDQYDVVIAGAGPAGSSLAIRLATVGRNVLIVEKATFPRQKVCGEYISSECTRHFAELGVHELINGLEPAGINRTVFFTLGGRQFSVPSEWFGSGPVALGLSRAEMDNALFERAKATGVTVFQDAQITDTRSDGVATLRCGNGKRSSITGNVFVDATGRSRSLTKLLSTWKTREPKATHIAFKTHLRNANVDGADCEIYSYRGGYGGCNRIEDGKYNLCIIIAAKDAVGYGSDPEKIVESVVFENARARHSLSNAERCSPWIAVPITRYGRGTLAPSTNLITTGDAAAFIDPFTGSGMLMAFESSRLAAEAILTTSSFDELSSVYTAAHRAAFDRRLRFCSALRYAAYSPILAETLVALLSKSRLLSRGVARATRSSAEPLA